MKLRSLAAASLIAACGTSSALAASAPAQPDTLVYAPSVIGGKHPLPYVQAPAASLQSHATDNGVAGAVVEAINADPSMKYSKLTVLPDENGITLTGVTITDAQRMRAMQIATQHAGEGQVGSAIQTEELVIRPLETSAEPTQQTGAPVQG